MSECIWLQRGHWNAFTSYHWILFELQSSKEKRVRNCHKMGLGTQEKMTIFVPLERAVPQLKKISLFCLRRGSPPQLNQPSSGRVSTPGPPPVVREPDDRVKYNTIHAGTSPNTVAAARTFRANGGSLIPMRPGGARSRRMSPNSLNISSTSSVRYTTIVRNLKTS